MKQMPSLPAFRDSASLDEIRRQIQQYARDMQQYVQAATRNDVKDYLLVASPNKTVWKILVSDAGVVSATQA